MRRSLHNAGQPGDPAKRIAIVTGLPLAQNPRTAREAETLARAGHSVTVYGAELARATLESDTALARRAGYAFQSVGSLRGCGLRSSAAALRRRARRKLGRVLFATARIENAYQVGYFVPELLRAAMTARADYYILHAEQALWIGLALLRAGRRFGVDMEDWYSEDLLPEDRAKRPLARLRELEAIVLGAAAHATCPSHAMSAALARELGCAAPAVLYNACSWSERESLDGRTEDRIDSGLPSIHWFSQTIGHGRGLDDLLAALPLVELDAELHLRGVFAEGFREWFLSRLPQRWKAHTYLHEPVAPATLLSRVAEHDIGFAGEQKYCRNKMLTVSNKVLAYLTAGLAVVASDTDGHQEVARAAGNAVTLYESGNPRSLAEHIGALLADRERLSAMKRLALRAGATEFSWDAAASTLLRSVGAGLTHA